MTVAGGPVALGVDVGGTKVAAALVGQDGTVLARERGAVAPESNEAGLAGIFAVTDRVLAARPDVRRRLAGVGVGVAGSVDWRTGVHMGATNLSWHDLPLGAELRERYGAPALVDNDVNVAAWGERCFGGRKDAADVPYDNLVFITVGTGIGAGLIEAGRIVRGKHAAGEIGHIPLIEDGPRCRCGMVGCLEAAASGPALAAAGRRLAEAGGAPRLLELAGGDLEVIAAPLVIRAAAEGDPGARTVLDREGYYLALATLVAGRMLDPELIVVGGGLAEAGAPVFAALWDHLARLRPRGPEPRTYVVPARLGADAGAIGAAALVLRPEAGFVAAGLIAA